MADIETDTQREIAEREEQGSLTDVRDGDSIETYECEADPSHVVDCGMCGVRWLTADYLSARIVMKDHAAAENCDPSIREYDE